ncbi:EVE domain-containing protein [Streptomyces globisporus]|uniref:EVE domain-containing protein n=1 Tax=Streptomyces globisporus TaxID=1908 RepID=UPI00378C770B
MSTWLLSCNPKKFDLEGHRRDGHVLSSWTVVRYVREVAEGDEFVLWVAGPDAGVVAYGRFTGPAEHGQPDLRYWAEDPGPRHFVPLVVDRWLDLRIPKARLASDPRMTGATVLRQPFAGSPHRLTEEEWRAVREAIEASEGSDPQWDLNPGEEIRRVDLHAKYGGSSQNGISPCSTTDNILIFTAPSSGHQHGYFDTWNEDGTFHYTGEGQTGDQRMVRGNKAILEHAQFGKRLRLFDGARGTVRYLGEWTLDIDEPYTEDQAPATGGGDLRKVIRFHLIPVRATITASEVKIGQDYVAPDENVVPAPVTPSAPDPDLVGRNLSTHRKLQNLLAQEAQRRGCTALSPDVSDPDFDLAWRDSGDRLTICEIKSLTPANEARQLRAGLGQVLDYQDQLSERAPEASAVLWVEREPSEQRWVNLCHRVGVILAWPGQENTLFERSEE